MSANASEVKLNPVLSLTSIEIMMRSLMQESETRMKDHMGTVCQNTISTQIQPLAEIAVERTERVIIKYFAKS